MIPTKVTIALHPTARPASCAPMAVRWETSLQKERVESARFLNRHIVVRCEGWSGNNGSWLILDTEADGKRVQPGEHRPKGEVRVLSDRILIPAAEGVEVFTERK